MKIPTILAISLAAVLASSLLLAGPFSIGSIFPAKHDDHVPEAEAQALPLVVRDRFTAKQMVGDALKVDEEFVDPENHCEFCTRVEYVPGPQGEAGFSYEDVTGVDLTGAKKVRFWVMGEEGNEKIKFKLAGKSLDKIQDKSTGKLTKDIFKTERFALTTEEVTLDDDWKKYEVDLSGVDLKGITHPFGFELSENDAQQVLYIKGVVYDEEPAVDALATVEEELIEGLTAEIISNGTEGTAPATFEFDANVTGGAEPYSITWDFDDDSEDEGQNVVHTFAETGEYNVTVAVTDAGGQNALGSVVIQVAEPGIVEEGMDNSTSTDTNATGSVEQQATAESIQADARSTVSGGIVSPAQLPFYVVDNSQTESNATGLKIRDSFVNPEIHCEICTAVDTTEHAEVAYTVDATDLTGTTKFVFWAIGGSGGENVTFKVAGKEGRNNAVAYFNTTSVILDSEWNRYEVDLAGADLQRITHLFGFEADSGQTFYVKGAAYY